MSLFTATAVMPNSTNLTHIVDLTPDQVVAINSFFAYVVGQGYLTSFTLTPIVTTPSYNYDTYKDIVANQYGIETNLGPGIA